MSDTLGLLQLVLITALLFGACASAVSGVCYSFIRQRLRRCAPADRAAVLLLWTAAPVLLAGLLTALCFSPSLVAVVTGGVGDHCLAHADHHVHLCLLHPPRGSGSLLAWSVLAVVVLLVAGAVARRAVALWRGARALVPLVRAAQPDVSRDVAWVRCPSLLALTVGLYRPRVLLAHALREQLASPLLDAVIAHERAHVRRRDVLRKTLASVLASLHPAATGRALIDDLSLACEQAADAAAAAAVHDPVRVADAILAVERLAGAATREGLAFAFAGHDIGARIEALLNPPPPAAQLHPRVWTGVGVVLALLTAEPLHHTVETLLTPFVR